MQSCGVRVIVRVLKKAVQTIRNDENTVRQFSAIAGLQQAYTLVYSLDPDGETGCRLTLCRTGSSQRMDSKYMAVAPEFGYRVLQYLCENGVQPEIWQDVVAELDAAQQTEQEGGAWRGQ